MCGICGVVNGSTDSVRVNEALLRQMCRVLQHRGPDDEGVWTDGFGGLGQRRLAIIDLSLAGHQPMSNETGSIWITYNGEIYNYRELRANLAKKGHQFRSRTDTEVIIHQYEENGVSSLQHLHGMFAFGLWDTARKRLMLARDRLGQKPLYYGVFNNTLYFASEIKAIVALPQVPRRVNWQAIDHYLTYRYVPGQLTAFDGIYKVPPGYYALWENGKLHLEQYWSPAFSPKVSIGEAEAQEQLLALLSEAVRCRMISDVPLGAFLSGGVDLGDVVALMSQHSRQVRTFSIGFHEMEVNELPYARQVAERFGTDHQEFVVEANAIEVLPHLIWHYDEPFADASAVPTYYVSQVTRQSVTVALSGDGSDESFGGYRRYQPHYHQPAMHWLPQAIRRPLLLGVSDLLPNHLDQRQPTLRLRRYLQDSAQSSFDWYMRTVRLFSADLKTLLYSEQMKERVGRQEAELWYRERYNSDDSLPPVERAMRADLLTYLPDAMLVKVDVASMAHSLEVRSPFLDHNLIEFAARLPLALKVKQNDGKYLLKKAMEHYLPPSILHRPKKGFSIPLARWLRNDMRPFVEEIVSEGEELPYFKPESVRIMLAAHMAGRSNYATHLWAIINLYLWHHMFITEDISPPSRAAI